MPVFVADPCSAFRIVFAVADPFFTLNLIGPVASESRYVGGFIMMTPQLFINYKVSFAR